MEIKKGKYRLIVLFVITAFCYYVGPRYPAFFSTTYHQKIYALIDWILHQFTHLFSFSIGDLMYALVILHVFYKTYFFIKNKTFIKLITFITTYILLFFSLFQILWGFNNYKYSLAHQLELDRNYTENDLNKLTHKLIKEVNLLHNELAADVKSKIVIEKDLALFNRIAKENYTRLPMELKEVLIQNPINKVKASFYSPFLSYSGFSGYFNPFTHENQVNTEVPSISMPITVAHEMAHQLGISSESEANFYGYQVMNLSNDLRFRYAANLYALRYCLKEHHHKANTTYHYWFSQLHPGIQENIYETEKFWNEKRTVSTFLFKHIYGRFLKINNQTDGIRSYNRFVDLLINYDKKNQEI